METQIDNQLAVMENSLQIFRTAPEIMKANQERSQKAVAVGNDILDQWHKALQIEDEDARMAALQAVDDRSNKYLVNCGKALKEEKELRAAITQLMDEFKKKFTAAENEIDKSKPDTVPAKVQKHRDNYAGEVHRIQERKRLEAERKAAKENERIELIARVRILLAGIFSNFLLTRKQNFQNKFNGLKLDSFADDAATIRQYTPDLKDGAVPLTDLKPEASLMRYHTAEEVQVIIDDVVKEKYPEMKEQYSAAMLEMKADLVDKLPSKHNELKEQKRLADEAEAKRQEELRLQREAEEKRQRELAAAKSEAERKRKEQEAEEARKAEKERLEKMEREAEEKRLAAEREQKDREEAERRRIEEEAEQQRKAAEQEAEISKQGDMTMNLFNKEAEIAEAGPAPSARLGYDLVVLHPAGWVQIFQFWFENEGSKLPADKIGNTKMDQMKAYAEKKAHKDNVKIESKYLRYDESFKAVNRKVKL